MTPSSASERRLTREERLVLDAYVDDQMTQEEEERACRLLQTSAAACGYVESCHRQNQLLKKMFDPVFREAPPKRLVSAIK